MASSYTHDLQFRYRENEETFTLTLVVTAHTDGSVTNICTDDMTYMTQTVTDVLKKGFWLTAIDTIPGTGGDQPDAYTVDVFDQDAIDISMTTGNIADIANRSQTVKERFIVSDTSGYWWEITSALTIALSSLGASNKTTVILSGTKG